MVKLLLVEDDSGYADLVRRRLSYEKSVSFEIEWVDQLEAGLKRLNQGGVDLVLLDLSLPDSRGLDTLVRLHSHYPNVPVLVLTGLDDESIAVEAVRRGAQDYLIKGELDGKILPRIISYALERHRIQEVLRNLALVDQLTGLYNRHGLVTLAEQQIKLAIRTKREFLLLLLDLDGLKHINDTLGHPEGDQALLQVVTVLQRTFRKSDIIARIGGDEFAVLAIEALKSGTGNLLARLEKNLEQLNVEKPKSYKISLSVGVTSFDPGRPISMDQLIEEADRALYQNKRAHKTMDRNAPSG